MLLISKKANLIVPSKNIDIIQLDEEEGKTLMTARIGDTKYLLAEFDSRDAAKESLLDLAVAWHEPIAVRVK